VAQRLRSLKIALPDSLGPEAYVLFVSPKEILVAGNSHQGVFYGVQTLRQLIRSNRSGNSIPCLSIIDWPVLKYRGWMDDISRGPIPTVEFLKHEIRTLSEYKLNFLTLYTENVFKLKSHRTHGICEGLSRRADWQCTVVRPYGTHAGDAILR
jgi:N-acetyl-beta-hexosaminidase